MQLDLINIPRSEYPRPQFRRHRWFCLNGQWEFEIDHSDTGLERGLLDRPLAGRISVPFCPESKLSGIEYKDFMNAVWYRREVEIPRQWLDENVLLHFQAVDYDTTVWVNGQEMVRHRGCWCGFSCDITEAIKDTGKALIVVRARDLKSEMGKPGGKQTYDQHDNYRCFYDRTTGIWQTVWMEPVSKIHLERPKITPDVANSKFRIHLPITNSRHGTKVRAVLFDDHGKVSEATAFADYDFTPMLELDIPEDRVKLWSCKSPFLYSITIELMDAEGHLIDAAECYSGLRGVTVDDKAVKINNEVVFQRQVLDQGYYPDGIMTAPTDEDLVRDIELSLKAGFNSARLHQKVFEERFLYHCDRLGYMVWAEFGDWGIDKDNPKATYITQWLEVLNRDYNHPCIIGWCGLNETWKELTDKNDYLNDLTLGMFLAAKSIDSTRPVIDASGYSHRIRQTDIYDSHCYEQCPEKFRMLHAGLTKGFPFINDGRNSKQIGSFESDWSLHYDGQPYFCSEFGGIKWFPNDMHRNCNRLSWGYGDVPKTLEEFYRRFEALCDVLLENENMFGYCYTQLTDVFQEKNGIYYFDRTEKFDMDRIRSIQTKPAAIERHTRKQTSPQKKNIADKGRLINEHT